MPPTLYLVRHAEAEHNIKHQFHIPDPVLTPRGRTQCRNLCKTFPHHSKIDLILSSPHRRASQTTLFAFSKILAQPEVRYLLVPNAQEVSAKPCDKGFPLDVLRDVEIPKLFKDEGLSFGVEKIDIELMEEGWNLKVCVEFLQIFFERHPWRQPYLLAGFQASHFYLLWLKDLQKDFYAPNHEAVQARAATLRAWLYQLEAQHVVLVTHGAFLHYLTEDGTVEDLKKGTAYSNCEFRIFTFKKESTAEDAHVVEFGKEKHDIETDSTILAELDAVRLFLSIYELFHEEDSWLNALRA
ncbi:hypothetical protein OCU04_010259 [Sclerotinia nivalis]|uniref:Phosphoglycerate mutase family protein n=1 Tax=Sclerotinia nivalis TaxID=352851 RepID=A0A9X0DF23_9HELO|nr:hypothetical protein OCU04_010259 [Sclerotinia nivalis]